ncbi:MAG: TIGR02594 family protein [Rhodobacterales bacterium]|nr:TIGR02594 family protein [Rhodobacterales bacterium]
MILDTAGEFLGLEEWPGPKHNPTVVKMFADVGHSWVTDDETPWCAAFVGSVLGSLSLPHTGRLNARSYKDYGTSVPVDEARPGDIVVFWRNSPESADGHVAFFVRFEGENLIVRGGNQGNKVSDAPYHRGRVIAVRRADGLMQRGKFPILREGDRGLFVKDLQVRLHELGYMVGNQDGKFGSRTLGAVVEFQNDNRLHVDGVVGDRTWEALTIAKRRPTRTVELTNGTKRPIELRDLKGKSRTIAEAEKGKDIVVKGGGTLSAGIIIDQVNEINAVVTEATSMAQMLSGLSLNVLIILGVIAVFWFVYHKFGRIEEIRVDDARTGVNDRI